MRGLILIYGLLVATFAFGQSFMEENDLHLQDSLYGNDITEEKFDDIIDMMQEVFEPISEKTGMDLDIAGYWNSSTVNAYASQRGNTRYVRIYGGLARRPEITEDGLTLVICHELGHHLGGFPQYTDYVWAANEGQSDFYSTIACARKVWSQVQNRKVMLHVLPEVREICNEVWYSFNNRNLCYRTLMGAKSLADLLASLHGVTVDFSKKDGKIVNETYEKHPRPQCRLDTYVAGALCEAKWDHTLIPKTEREADWVSCPESKYQYGAKPKCWYAPSR